MSKYRPRLMVEENLWGPALDVYSFVSLGQVSSMGVRIIYGKRLADVVMRYPYSARYLLPPDWDGPNFCDGEWLNIVGMPCRAVEFAGRLVPLWRI